MSEDRERPGKINYKQEKTIKAGKNKFRTIKVNKEKVRKS
jgi:hypothetical protein